MGKMWVFKFLLIVAVVLSCEAKPKNYRPFRKLKANDASFPRLGSDVLPTEYWLTLTIKSEEALKAGNYTGTVKIKIVANKETETFKIHARDLVLHDLTITSTENEAAPYAKVNASEADEADQVTITSDKALTEGDSFYLTINFDGELSTTEMAGFYLSTYVNKDGDTEYLATTQFEEMDARKAFPSFDEPALKAYFTVTINHPKTYTAWSNTPIDTDPTNPPEAVDGLTQTVFHRTPQMSTYLIAFIVSKYGCTKGSNDPVPTEVCSRIGTDETRTLAVSTAPKSLNAMKDYTNVDYSIMGVGKLSQAAIPDFAAGAMENWGMITYREVDILNDEKESSNYYKQGVVTVITHELSHQWFGDYVTLDWWSDIFLNEGFATYFEYHASDIFQEKWELTKQFVLEQVQTVLLYDSSGSSYPLHYDSTDPDVINSRFDDISYNKGGTILRMIHHFLGLDNFKKALNKYLNKGIIGQPEHLWAAFQEVVNENKIADLPDTIAKIMDSWVNKAGYPVLTVTLSEDGKSVTVNQTQFLLSGKTTDTKWYVPITYTTSISKDFDNTATKAWLTPDKDLVIDLKGAEWIILNNQQVGYYRVKYDDKLFEKISDLLQNNLGDIDEISRSQIVDDQLNYARAGQKNFGDVLKFLGSFLSKETSYYVWYPTFTGFTYLLQKTDNKEVKNALNALIAQLIDTYAKQAPFDSENTQDQIFTLSQVLGLTWACKSTYGTCIADSKNAFAEYKSKNTSVPANLKGIVYCNALRNSDNSAEDYDFLWKAYQTSIKNLATDQIEILKALGCVNNSTLRKQYLAEALGTSVRLQDARYVFSSVYSNNAEAIDDVLDFIADKHKDFEPHFQDDQSTLIGLLSTVSKLFTNQKQIDKLTNLIQIEDLDASVKSAAATAIDTANASVADVTKLETTLRDYFNLNNNNSAVMNSYHFVNLALIFVVYLWFNH